MYRINTPADVATTGRVKIDTGDGVTFDAPVVPAVDPAARLAALEYDSGWRDLSGTLGDQYISGQYWARRVGSTVWLHFYQLALVHTGGTSIRPSANLPIGFRPDTVYAYLPFAPRNGDKPWVPTVGTDASGPMRVSKFGVQDIYNISAGQLISADVSYLTSDARPATLPGVPGV